MTRTSKRLCVGVLLATHAVLSILSMRHESPMTDEGGHYSYGRRILEGNTEFEDTPYGVGKMPFSAFNALPWALAEKVGLERSLIRLATRNRDPAPTSTPVPREQVFPVLTGRLATVVFSILLAWVVFSWSSRLYGFGGGLLSLFLYAFCPNLLAHSHVVMVDLYAALMVTVASYVFWQYLRRGGWSRAALSALMLGIAQLAKYTCLFLYPVFALVGLIVSWPQWVECARSGDSGLWRRRLVHATLVLSLFLAVGLVVLNIGYLGQGSFTPLSRHTFQSTAFQSLQAAVLQFADPPVPLPTTPVIGVDALRYYERAGLYFPNLYLLGEVRLHGENLEGFKSYYLVAWLFKVPIVSQLVLLVSLAGHLRKKGREYFTAKELALAAPLIFYSFYFSFLFKAQIGVRHFLVVFPLLFIVCGAAARGWERKKTATKLAAGCLGIYLVASVLSYYPHFLAYFNELVWDRKQAHKILADSNIDMNQSEWFLEDYLEEHPGTVVNPWYIDQPGRIVANVNLVVGVLFPGQYGWLRENLEPVDHIAYSYLVYEIKPEHLHLVHRRPPPSPMLLMRNWIEANIPKGVGILKENHTPTLDRRRYLWEHKPFLGQLSRDLLTRGKWDYVLVASGAYGVFFPREEQSDEEHQMTAKRYDEIFEWPLAAEFGSPVDQNGPRVALYRVPRDKTDYRTHRRWAAERVSWVSDEAIRSAVAGGPLLFTRRGQIAVFKGAFEPGLYQIKLSTKPARHEAYVNVMTPDNRDVGSFRASRMLVVELPRRDKYLIRVFQGPGSRLSEVVIRPAPEGAVASETLPAAGT